MNWLQLLDDYNIDYVSRGPNTKRGEVSVQCPWCGEDDPSHHLGIALEGERWGCHRDQAHRGKAPYRLIQGLLGCSHGQARLVAAQYDASDPETLDQALSALTATPEAPKAPVGPLIMPPEFRLITPGTRFWRYLENRGFSQPAEVSLRYQLRCCTTGRWKDRIIIPIYDDTELVGWTGRALQNPIEAPRYLSTSETIKLMLFEEHRLESGGSIMFVTEGPFDAIKVDFYGADMGKKIVATCCFGVSMTSMQLTKLRKYSKRFDKTVVLFDKDAIGPAFELTDWLPGAVQGVLPTGIKDPGELTQDQVIEMINSHL